MGLPPRARVGSSSGASKAELFRLCVLVEAAATLLRREHIFKLSRRPHVWRRWRLPITRHALLVCSVLGRRRVHHRQVRVVRLSLRLELVHSVRVARSHSKLAPALAKLPSARSASRPSLVIDGSEASAASSSSSKASPVIAEVKTASKCSASCRVDHAWRRTC